MYDIGCDAGLLNIADGATLCCVCPDPTKSGPICVAQKTSADAGTSATAIIVAVCASFGLVLAIASTVAVVFCFRKRRKRLGTNKGDDA